MKTVLLTATVQSHICQFHRTLADMLHEHGCEVHVAARNNLAEKNGLTLDFADQVFDVPFSRSPKSADNIRAYRQLGRIVDEGNYDIIHSNTPMGGVITRLAARRARKKGTKVFYTAHGFHFYKGAPKKNWMVFYPIEKCMAHFCDVLITINREDYELAGRKFHTKVEYIHGVGVDEKRFHPVTAGERLRLRREMGYGEHQKILLCVGELLPNKNQIMALRAVRQLKEKIPEILLLLAGNGPEKTHLEKYAEEEHLGDHVKFLGYCTNLEQYQQIADIAVSCSRREGLPLNIVEAMLTGNPVVATRNRGHCELLRRKSADFLVDADDVASMADYIERILGDEKVREKIREQNSAYIENYTAKNVLKELKLIYGLGTEWKKDIL